ncbi:hypothetical protein KEJ17_02130, partial [Candidatus Bathyarchaeota archaeon]|nr:hypothetical protein [Candidatus Bathyarchaeota archaeon]
WMRREDSEDKWDRHLDMEGIVSTWFEAWKGYYNHVTYHVALRKAPCGSSKPERPFNPIGKVYRVLNLSLLC